MHQYASLYGAVMLSLPMLVSYRPLAIERGPYYLVSSYMDSGNVTFHQGAWFFLLVFCSAEPSNAESLLYRAYILAPAASASP